MLLRSSSQLQSFLRSPGFRFRPFSGVNVRSPAGMISLEPNLMSKNPELVKEHIRARQSYEEVLGLVDKVDSLVKNRDDAFKERENARVARKDLSKQIWAKMSSGGSQEEIEKMKKAMEIATETVQKCEKDLVALDIKVDRLMLSFPNLIDDRFVTF
jgi:seryl-tRNA synthetase